MALHKDTAVVLRRLDYSETSQVLAFFGRTHGQVRLIAKGIKRGTRKAFATGIDLLELGEAVFAAGEHRAGLGTLTEWRQADAFLGLRTAAARLYAAQYAAEVTSHLTEEHDAHPALFDALVALLRALCDGEESLTALVRFQIVLLTEIGLMPVFDRCAACQTAPRSGGLDHFSGGEGGMICRDCEPSVVEKRRVSRAVAAAIASDHVSPELAAGAFDVLNYAIAYIMGREPKLASFVHAGLG